MHWFALGLILYVGPGCAKTIAFGTATKFGLDISQRPDQTIDVTLGYDREEVASIPAPEGDVKKNEDTYSVLGIFYVKYGNPWTFKPLQLNQIFATGWAAREAANDKRLQEFFGKKAAEISKKGGDGN
jgi:hypothetical protein